MELNSPFPVHGQAFELVEQSKGLLDGIAKLAQALDVRDPLREITGMILRRRNAWRTALEPYALSPRTYSGCRGMTCPCRHGSGDVRRRQQVWPEPNLSSEGSSWSSILMLGKLGRPDSS